MAKFNFNKYIEDQLLRLGATCPPVNGYAMYPFKMNTIAGELGISPNDNWVACRFDEVEKANEKVSGKLNRFSGKWNFHFQLNPGKAEADDFLSELERLLPEDHGR
jgi:hypothetical protein